jgi:hypothetical protein
VSVSLSLTLVAHVTSNQFPDFLNSVSELQSLDNIYIKQGVTSLQSGTMQTALAARQVFFIDTFVSLAIHSLQLRLTTSLFSNLDSKPKTNSQYLSIDQCRVLVLRCKVLRKCSVE